jgi:hypothetical protein
VVWLHLKYIFFFGKVCQISLSELFLVRIGRLTLSIATKQIIFDGLLAFNIRATNCYRMVLNDLINGNLS